MFYRLHVAALSDDGLSYDVKTGVSTPFEAPKLPIDVASTKRSRCSRYRRMGPGCRSS